MSYDKRYIDTFLAGKPIEYRIDFESISIQFKKLNYDICNNIFKKHYKNNFATKFIGIIPFNKGYVHFFFIKFDKMMICSMYRNVFEHDYKKLKRKLTFDNLIQN